MINTQKIILILMFMSILKADEIVIGADNYCPINCEPNSEKPGYMIEVAEVLFEKAGHKLVYKTIPWTRALKLTRAGKINGVVGASYRDDMVFPKNELGVITNSFFTKVNSTWKFIDISSLSKIKLGVISNYMYGEKLDKYIKEYKGSLSVQQIGDNGALLQNIKKLQNSRIDTLVEATPIFWYTVLQLGLQNQFKSVGKLELADKIYIAFSSKNEKSKEYADILSKGIEDLRESGELKTILAKYGLKDWK